MFVRVKEVREIKRLLAMKAEQISFDETKNEQSNIKHNQEKVL